VSTLVKWFPDRAAWRQAWHHGFGGEHDRRALADRLMKMFATPTQVVCGDIPGARRGYFVFMMWVRSATVRGQLEAGRWSGNRAEASSSGRAVHVNVAWVPRSSGCCGGF